MKAKKNLQPWKKELAKKHVFLNEDGFNRLQQAPCTTLLKTPMYVIADGNKNFRELKVMKNQISWNDFEFKIRHMINKNKKKLKEIKE